MYTDTYKNNFHTSGEKSLNVVKDKRYSSIGLLFKPMMIAAHSPPQRPHFEVHH